MPVELRAGYDTYWQSIGSGDVTALALHCSLASSDTWRGVGGALDDQLSLIAPDFIGHGKSEDWFERTDLHTNCTNQAASFLIQPTHLIGHSFGATIALRLAIEIPELVKSLTLIEPVFFVVSKGTKEFERHLEEFEPFGLALENNDLDEAAKVFTEVWGTGASWESLPLKMRNAITQRIHLIPATVDALYDDNAALVDRIADISCPVQFIEGADSPEIISTISQMLESKIPDARRTVISGASHMVPITHSRQVAKVIRDFLNL